MSISSHTYVYENCGFEEDIIDKGLSLAVNAFVDTNSGEIISLLDSEEEIPNQIKIGNGIIQNNKGRDIGEWGEYKILQLLNGYKKTYNNYLWDLEDKNSIIECKSGLLRYGIVIRETQLSNISDLELKNKYYTLIFYNINKKGNKYVEKIFIFPVEYIIKYYNTSSNTRILTKTGYIKKLHIGNTIKMYNSEKKGFKKREVKLWGKLIYIIEYENHTFDISKKAL